ncbi:MAG: hypothetical protein VYA34_17270 [Myxococcota bacterium]|nr:hypothetical protein [Myxococcota bacterium]
MLNRLIYTFILVLPLAFVLTNCGSGRTTSCRTGDCQDDETTPTSDVVACVDSTECDEGFECDNGDCVVNDTLTCSSTNDCPAGMTCDLRRSVCVDCLTDTQCPEGLVCLEGACSEAPAPDSESSGETNPDPNPDPNPGSSGNNNGCAGDADCSFGRCDVTTGQCVDCLTSGDCPSGNICRDNICIEPSSPSGPGGGTGDLGDLFGGATTSCASQVDCDASCTVCNLSTSMCESCSAALSCANGRQCLDGAQLGVPIGSYCVQDPTDFTALLSCLSAGVGGGGGGLPEF